MLFSPLTFYIAYLVGQRFPVIHLYTGTLMSTLGLFAIAGYQFPATAIIQALYMIQMALVVDTFMTNKDVMWKVAGYFLCYALMQPPDVYYAASLGIYALSPTYYGLGSVAPATYRPFIQGLLHIAQFTSALLYISSKALSIYTATLHLIFLTLSTYEFGRWISRLRAV